MKSLLRIFAVLLVINVSTWFAFPKASAQVAVSFQVFYDDLSPYGAWVDNPSYGYVWVPSVGVGFSPYATSGHWVYSEFGWMWVSNYEWGWAPFHYGRWYFDPIYGWIWVPDTIWGPAWVAWSSAPGYYGWAPLEPGWDVDVVVIGRIPPERWIFVPDRDIDRDDIAHYYGPRTQNAGILKSASVINKTNMDNTTHAKYIVGPDPTDVQKRTGRPLQPVKVRQADRPEQKLNKDELVIYRPQVQKAAPNGEKPRPTKVIPMKEVRPVKERGAENQGRPVNSPKQMENPKAAPQRDVTPANKQQQQNPNPPRKDNPNQQQKVNPNPPRNDNPNPPRNDNPNPPRNDNPNPPRNDNPKNNNEKEPVQPSDNNPPGNESQPQNPPGDVNPAPANEAQQPPRENPPEIKQDQPPPQPEQPQPQPAHKKKRPKE